MTHPKLEKRVGPRVRCDGRRLARLAQIVVGTVRVDTLVADAEDVRVAAVADLMNEADK